MLLKGQDRGADGTLETQKVFRKIVLNKPGRSRRSTRQKQGTEHATYCKITDTLARGLYTHGIGSNRKLHIPLLHGKYRTSCREGNREEVTWGHTLGPMLDLPRQMWQSISSCVTGQSRRGISPCVLREKGRTRHIICLCTVLWMDISRLGPVRRIPWGGWALDSHHSKHLPQSTRMLTTQRHDRELTS